MSNGDIVVNLLLSPLELNFLQAAVDGLIDIQRDAIIDCARDLDPDVVDSAEQNIKQLSAGLALKHTLRVYNL